MSQAQPEEGGAGSEASRWVGAALCACVLGWAIFLYYGVGAQEGGSGWWVPSGFLIAEVPEAMGPAMALLVLPAAAVCTAMLLATRSALLGFLAVSAVVASACITFYGVGPSGVWGFFHWRWSVCILLFSLVVGAALTSPALAASWRRLPMPLRWAVYLPIVLIVMAFVRNVTGTDPDLFLALAPWPVVQILGVDLAASIIAALLVGASVGLLAVAQLGSGPRGLALAAGGFLLAVALPLLVLRMGSSAGFLPFSTPPAFFVLTGAAAVLLPLALGLPILRQPARLAERGRAIGLGAVLLSVPLVLGQGLARLDYSITRDGRAQEVIDALAAFRAREQAYPAQLTELVTAGDLERIPVPAIGFSLLSSQEFVYQDFGDNYVLEFSAPRWVQCAYNPPYELTEEEIEELTPEELADLAGGAWSCPSRPPELF